MNRLKELRSQQKISQTQIADYLGISYQAYAHYESERRQPDPETLLKLADFYNVSVDYLLGRNEGLMNKKLNELIKKAQGDRTQNQFALNCNINSATLTRVFSGENKPKPDLLKKIAAHAHNNVSYNDLMIAAGYLEEKDTTEIVVPDNMDNVPVAFFEGLKDLSQEDMNAVSDFVEFLKSKKK